MSYFKKYPCGGILESSDFIEYLNTLVDVPSLEPFTKRLNGPNQPSSNPYQNQQQLPKSQMSKEEAVLVLAKVGAKVLLGHIITLFVDLKLSQYTVTVVRKNQKNKKLFNFINSQVDLVYRKHPEYTSCNAKEFMQTSIFQYMLAEWREKTAKERAKLLGYKSLDSAISALVINLVPIPGSPLLVIPIKMVLSYCGIRGIIGSFTNVALEIDGNTISFGLDVGPNGWVFSNLILYTFNPEKKLIGINLKDPPESYYQVTNEDIEEIIQKYGDDTDLDTIRKEVNK